MGDCLGQAISAAGCAAIGVKYAAARECCRASVGVGFAVTAAHRLIQRGARAGARFANRFGISRTAVTAWRVSAVFSAGAGVAGPCAARRGRFARARRAAEHAFAARAHVAAVARWNIGAAIRVGDTVVGDRTATRRRSVTQTGVRNADSGSRCGASVPIGPSVAAAHRRIVQRASAGNASALTTLIPRPALCARRVLAVFSFATSDARKASAARAYASAARAAASGASACVAAARCRTSAARPSAARPSAARPSAARPSTARPSACRRAARSSAGRAKPPITRSPIARRSAAAAAGQQRQCRQPRASKPQLRIGNFGDRRSIVHVYWVSTGRAGDVEARSPGNLLNCANPVPRHPDMHVRPWLDNCAKRTRG